MFSCRAAAAACLVASVSLLLWHWTSGAVPAAWLNGAAYGGLAVIAMAAMARCASQWHPALRRTAVLLACSILAGIDVGVSGLHGEAAQKTFFAALLGIALVVVAARHAPAVWRRRWLGEGQP